VRELEKLLVDYSANIKSLKLQTERKRQKKAYYQKRNVLLKRLTNQTWVLFVLGLSSIRDLLASFEEGQQDVLGRIAWKQEFDVDDFVFQLSTIRNVLNHLATISSYRPLLSTMYIPANEVFSSNEAFSLKQVFSLNKLISCNEVFSCK